jgi:hypothetical protein
VVAAGSIACGAQVSLPSDEPRDDVVAGADAGAYPAQPHIIPWDAGVDRNVPSEAGSDGSADRYAPPDASRDGAVVTEAGRDTGPPLDGGGTQTAAYANMGTILLEVLLPSGATREVGIASASLFDVALHPNGTLFAVGTSALYTVDKQTAAITFVQNTPTGLLALEFAPDGRLFAAGGQILYQLDPAMGTSTPVGIFPQNLIASGDIAFYQGRLLATAKTGPNSPANDPLVEFDLAQGTSSVISTVGETCVHGLVVSGTTLFGLTCWGKVLVIDPQTGATSVTFDNDYFNFYGATVR